MEHLVSFDVKDLLGKKYTLTQGDKNFDLPINMIFEGYDDIICSQPWKLHLGKNPKSF